MIGQTMRYCQKDDHQAPWEDMYTYRDSTHGITSDIQICARCLLKHVKQYWPGSVIEKHLLDRHPEWREKEARQESLFTGKEYL